MEPMAGIFSSPASPPKRTAGTSSSNAMELQDSTYSVGRLLRTETNGETNKQRFTGSAPDVDETLNMRRTPRLPPPRATTPRHTNIGSPKRMSSARPQSRHAEVDEETPDRAATQPPANRVLDFNGQKARIMRADTGSPFKPKKVLRRSTGGARQSQLTGISASSPERPQLIVATESVERELDRLETEAGANDVPDEEQQQLDDQLSNDAPMFNNDDDDYDEQREEEDAEITQALETAEQLLQTTPSTTKKVRGRPRKSDGSTQASINQHTPQTAQGSSRKRDRTEIEDDEADQTVQSIEQTEHDVSHVSTTSTNPAKRQRGRPRKSEVTVLQDPTEQTVADMDQTVQSIEQGDNEESQISTTAGNTGKRRPGRPRKSDVTVVQEQTEQAIDPTILAHGDSYLAPVNEDEEVEIAPASPVTKKKKGGRKPKAQKASQAKRAPKERDPNQSMRRTPSASPGKKSKDRDQAQTLSPSKRTGKVSNVNLRASTPFEDAHQRMSRSGRPILAPLKHWAGESYVWKNGEVEGIIRADEVKTPKAGKKQKGKGRRRVPRAGGRGASHDLGDIAEESDTESTVPDDWEEQVGVIAGTVAAWDPDLQQGNPEDPIREGIIGSWFLSLTNANSRRYRICRFVDLDEGRCRLRLPVREDYDPTFLRIWNRRASARGLQAREELAENADGVLCARRQGAGDCWPTCY